MKKILLTLFILLVFNNSQAGLFSKKIKVTKCYEMKKYSSWKQLKKDHINHLWEWEINPEEKTAILTFHGGYPPKVYIQKHKIIMQTDKYIVVSDNKTPDTKFDLKRERVITEFDEESVKILSLKNSTNILQCNFS